MMPTTHTEETLRRNILKIIGQGIDFPFQMTSEKTVKLSNAMERINDSIHIILATRIGERMFNPEFGSRLPELVFEPNDLILQRLLKLYTAEALRRWEKRIQITTIQIQPNLNDNENSVGIIIEYAIRNSHIRGSYVYPFVRGGMPTGDLYTGEEAQRMFGGDLR
jgi:phage baseplate assembly protein W